MSDSNKELPVLSFFEKEESIGLITRIDIKGDIKTDLLEKLDLSDKTLTKLLEDAQDAHLLKEVPITSEDHPRSTRYQLTERGANVRLLLNDLGLDEAHREFMKNKKKLQNATPDVKERIEELDLHATFDSQEAWSKRRSTEQRREMQLRLEERAPELADEYEGNALPPEQEEDDRD